MQCLNLFPNNRKTVFQFLNIDSGCSIFACRNLLLIFFFFPGFEFKHARSDDCTVCSTVLTFCCVAAGRRIEMSVTEFHSLLCRLLSIFGGERYYMKWPAHIPVLHLKSALSEIYKSTGFDHPFFFLAWQSNQTILSLLAIHSSWIMFMLLGLCSCCWYFGITNQKQIINLFMYY